MNSEELQKLKLEEEIDRDLIHRYPTTKISSTPTPATDLISLSPRILSFGSATTIDTRVLLRRRRRG